MTRADRLALYAAHDHLPERMVRAKFYLSARLGHGDDLIQVGRIALWRSTQFYEPGRGSFSSLAAVAIWREQVREAKRLRGVVRVDSLNGAWRRDVPRDVELSEVEGAAASHPLSPDSSAWLMRHLASAKTAAMVRRVVLAGETCAEVGDDYGLSKQAVHHRIKGGLAQMREAVGLEAA